MHGAMIGPMPSLGGRTFVCGLFACAASVVQAGDAAGGVGTLGLPPWLVAQVAAPPSTGSATYTPMRRPGSSSPPAATPSAPTATRAPSTPVYAPPVAAKPANPVPVVPAYRAPAAPAPTVSGTTSRANPEPYSAAPLQVLPAPPPIHGVDAASGATVSVEALRPVKPVHRVFGLASDLGMPDGLNLGLVLSPADWVRLGASIGTNSASFNYRGGLSLVPMGWGPSFSLEAGHCNTAPTTSIVRTFFSVPSWVQPYVQQLGYTYINAHLGFDYRWGALTVFVHGGYTYLMGTIRSPDSVVVDSKTNTSIKISQDGSVTAYTLSAKAGVVYMFGGP